MCLVVTGVSTLIHLYSVAYMGGDRGYTRFFAYLNFFVFSMLLLVLAAQLLPADRRLGVRRRGVLPADLASGTAARRRRTAGIKAFVINVVGDVGLVLGTYFIFKHTRHARLPADLRRGRPTRSRVNQADLVAGLHPAARRRVRQVRPDPAAHLAPGRDGGPDAGLRPDPRGDDGHRRRLPDRAHAPAVRAGARGRRRRRDHRLRDAADRRARSALVVTDLKRVIAYSTMSQIGYMIMAVSLGRLRRRAVPPDDARLLQGAAVHGGRLGHRRDGAASRTSTSMGGFRKAMPFTFGCFVIGGLALSGVPPFSGFFSKDEILRSSSTAAAGTSSSASLGYVGAFLTAIYTFRMIFRAFCGEPVAGGARARARPPATTRRADATRPPARSRTPTSASPAPSTTSPSARCR